MKVLATTRRRDNLTAAGTGKHATILDVARTAGVSKSTVSNVIGGVGRFTPETQLRVLEAIEKLGYRPNVLARQLVQQRTTTLGVVVGALSNPFYAEMAMQIEREASGRGYNAMFCNTQGSEDAELRGLEGFLNYRAAGILFVSHPAEWTRARKLVDGRVPVVFVSCEADWGDVVAGDDQGGAKLATQHLVDLGHKRIAYFADPIVEDAANRDRRAGYLKVMERSGLKPTVFHWDRHLPDKRDVQVAGILRKGITAVFTTDDYGAIELLEAADRLGVRVPDELSVVGFDDVIMSGLARIKLTTVRQPKPQLANAALEILTGRVRGELQGAPIRRTVPVELVVRGSAARLGG